jgi:ABC-type branched-subunit amino acid transport system ATPase component
LVRRVTSRLYLLDFGQLVVSGTTTEVMEHPSFRRAYLGYTA